MRAARPKRRRSGSCSLTRSTPTRSACSGRSRAPTKARRRAGGSRRSRAGSPRCGSCPPRARSPSAVRAPTSSRARRSRSCARSGRSTGWRASIPARTGRRERSGRRRSGARGRRPRQALPGRRTDHRARQRRPCGRRRLLRARARRDPRPRRRVGERQDDRGELRAAADGADVGDDPAARHRHHASVAPADAPTPPRAAHGLPGSVLVAEPADDGRRHRRRAGSVAPPGEGSGAGRPRCGDPRRCGAASGAALSLPARAFGRAAPARGAGAFADPQPERPRRRRARVGARRVGSSVDPQPPPGPAAHHGLLVPVHHARSRDGGVPLRPRRGHVPRRDRRARAARRALPEPSASLHAGAALGRRRSRPGGAAGAAPGRARRGCAEPARTAERLPLPYAPPAAPAGRGGNAFDAAVAAGFTLQVAEPHLNGPGGDLPAVLGPAGRGEPLVLCAQGPAPRAATVERYRDDLGLQLVPGTGPLAAVVPGAFGGWLALLRDFGTLPLRDVLAYAIGYAEDGYPVLPRIASAIANVESLFREDWTTSADVYLPVPEPGSLHRNPALAATYRRLLDEAEARSSSRDEQLEAALEAWYGGFVAEAFLAFQEREWLDSSGEPHRGLLAEEDLRDWRASYEPPLLVDYHGLTVLKAGPWSQAPVFLQQLLLLEGFDLVAMTHAGAEYVHTVTECAKLAFADREAWYGDPAFVDVPLDDLLSREYADERRALVGDESSPELRPGSPGGREPRLAAPAEVLALAPGVGEPTRGDTVHLDVVDRWGNMVAATPSGGWLWGAPVIPELGFCLGTRAQMFWLEEGLPNSLEPGKRPRTTLSPTLVARGGEPYLALGTPGGDQQDQWTLNTFLAHG